MFLNCQKAVLKGIMTKSIVVTYVSVISYLFRYLVIFDLVFMNLRLNIQFTVHSSVLITFKIKLFKQNVSFTNQFSNKTKQFSP